jgi:hypothetical protein
MPLIIRIEAVGLEEGEQPSIARNMMADAAMTRAEMPLQSPDPLPQPPPPFITQTLVLA